MLLPNTTYAFEQKAPPPREIVRNEPFDFVERITHGRLLLVGEGNLSFARSLAERTPTPSRIVATTYEAQNAVSEATRLNSAALADRGVRVLHSVDAAKLDDQFRPVFGTVAFQFPNAGSRRSVHGGTANHHLIRRFLRSAANVLRKNGVVAITTVDRAYYHGLFDIPGAAAKTGYTLQAVRPFRRTHWSGYAHVNTLDVGGALRATYRACTWILSPPTSSRQA